MLILLISLAADVALFIRMALKSRNTGQSLRFMAFTVIINTLAYYIIRGLTMTMSGHIAVYLVCTITAKIFSVYTYHWSKQHNCDGKPFVYFVVTILSLCIHRVPLSGVVCELVLLALLLIAVSRAFLSKAHYVILDEPTASLDPIAESRMYGAFSEILSERGTIIISHRLASAKMADKIIVMDGGEVDAVGSHVELMKVGGLYAVMFEEQSRWYRPIVDNPSGEVTA